MTMLTPEEKLFLDVFLCEATTAPFTGPATEALHQIGAEYSDMSYIAWAYHKEVPRTSFVWGYPAAVSPPLPWQTRDAVLRRDKELQRIWEQQRERAQSSIAS